MCSSNQLTAQEGDWWSGLSSNLCADSCTCLTKGLSKRGARRLRLGVLLLGAVVERFGATGVVGNSMRTRESARLPIKVLERFSQCFQPVQLAYALEA